MAYVNLPGVFPEKQDGGLRILTSSTAPKVLILGTSGKGVSEFAYTVGRAQEAAVQFGTEGNLIRGMYEAKSVGAENVILFRMGATAASAEGIGVNLAVGGVSIETIMKDDEAGATYELSWLNGAGLNEYNEGVTGLEDATFAGPYTGLTDAYFEVVVSLAAPIDEFRWRKNAGAWSVSTPMTGAAQALSDGVTVLFAATTGHTLADVWVEGAVVTTYKRLRIRNTDSGAVIYDRNFSQPAASINFGEVVVSGEPTTGEGENIPHRVGTYIDLSTTGLGSPAGQILYAVTVVQGLDGLNPSRVEMYENLALSYRLLANELLDIVCPMDVYLDDLSVADMDSAEVTTRNLAAIASYASINVGMSNDVLGLVYSEEYQGELYFWWWFPSDPDAARNATFILDGGAEIFPAAASATTKMNGDTLTGDDFHEVNFAYQLADFCWTMSGNTRECFGTVGVKPPASVSMKDVALWVGTLPTYTLDVDGTYKITSAIDDGTGLLGNKFVAGQYGFRGGIQGGGLIGTEEHYLDGTEVKDRGGHEVDIGAYLNIAAFYPTMFNPIDVSGLGYIATGAPTYAGFISTLDSRSAPTNKVLPGVRLPFRVGPSKLDEMAGVKLVMLQSKPRGIVVTDAPTAALQTSDYQRLTTVRICRDVIEVVRGAIDPFIGEALSDSQRAALNTAIESVLMKMQKIGYIKRFNFNVSATAAQMVAGDAFVELNIVPAFELRQVTLVVSLSAT